MNLFAGLVLCGLVLTVITMSVLVLTLIRYVRRHTRLQEKHLMMIDGETKELKRDIHFLDSYNNQVTYKFGRIRQWMIDFKIPRRYWG